MFEIANIIQLSNKKLISFFIILTSKKKRLQRIIPL